MKNFHYRFLRYESCEVETWYTHGQLADVSCIPESGARAHISWSYFLKGFTIYEKFLLQIS